MSRGPDTHRSIRRLYAECTGSARLLVTRGKKGDGGDSALHRIQLVKQERKHASHQQLTGRSNINVGAGGCLIAEMLTIPRNMIRKSQKLNAILS